MVRDHCSRYKRTQCIKIYGLYRCFICTRMFAVYSCIILILFIGNKKAIKVTNSVFNNAGIPDILSSDCFCLVFLVSITTGLQLRLTSQRLLCRKIFSLFKQCSTFVKVKVHVSSSYERFWLIFLHCNSSIKLFHIWALCVSTAGDSCFRSTQDPFGVFCFCHSVKPTLFSSRNYGIGKMHLQLNPGR